MTDLSAIFRNKPSMASQTINNRSSYSSQKLATQESPNNVKVEMPYTSNSKAKAKAFGNDLIN
jgi:hypothetical protein